MQLEFIPQTPTSQAIIASITACITFHCLHKTFPDTWESEWCVFCICFSFNNHTPPLPLELEAASPLQDKTTELGDNKLDTNKVAHAFMFLNIKALLFTNEKFHKPTFSIVLRETTEAQEPIKASYIHSDLIQWLGLTLKQNQALSLPC